MDLDRVLPGWLAPSLGALTFALVTWAEKLRPKPFTVKYHLLSSMLLNELQKQHERDEAQALELRALQARLEALEALVVAEHQPGG